MVAIVSNKREFIFKAVEDMYTDVAQHPLKGFHFPTGRLACLFVGYPAAQLDRIPATATESFAGVGYPFAANVIRDGDVVLDIGSGAGTDTLIASLLTGEGGVPRSRRGVRPVRQRRSRRQSPRARRRRRGNCASWPQA